MAANWALHGVAILQNKWARWSMVTAVIYLGLLLLLFGAMAGQAWYCHRRSYKDKEEFARQFRANGSAMGSPWPYTRWMDYTGHTMAALHVVAPLASGVLLLLSIAPLAPKPLDLQAAANAAISQSCCAHIANDVSAIRHSVEAFAASESQGVTTTVAGETEIKLPGWTILSVGLLTAIGGMVVLWKFKGPTSRAVGTALVTLGLTCSGGGLALIKELKVESLFTIKTDKLFEYVRTEIASLGGTGPEQLGFVDRFKLGDERLLELSSGDLGSVRNSPKVAAMAEAWLVRRNTGMNSVLLVIGSTDRLPITGGKLHQFDANVSLARARAEEVKGALLTKCRDHPACDMKEEQVIVLVSGSLHTPSKEFSPPAASREGFPEDRRVDVWAIWTRKPLVDGKR